MLYILIFYFIFREQMNSLEDHLSQYSDNYSKDFKV